MMQPLLVTDLDGVGAEMDGNLRRLWAETYPHLELPPAFTSWNWHAEISKEHTKAFNELLASQDFFGSISEIEGWSAAMNELLDNGIDVLVGTTPWHSSEFCHAEKVDWVSRIAGHRWRERTMMLGDKTILDADVLIDDKPKIVGRNTGRRRARPFWQQIYFDQPYNQGVPGMRIMNWTDGTWRDTVYAALDYLPGVR